jgi:alanyl aminopeptidase
MKNWLAVLLLAAATPLFASDPAPPAFRLGDAAAPRGYSARLRIDPRETRFSAEIRIELRFNRAAPVLWLNATGLEIEAADVSQGERRMKARIIPGGERFVGLAPEEGAFDAGDAVATIRYGAPLESVNPRGLFRRQEGGESYVVSQFEALDARRAFPCFDEPGWKVPWQLTVDAPAGDIVVSNTPETLAADLPDRPGWRRHEFARTQPLPSYLVALAVGPFDVVDGGTAGRNRTPLRYFAAKGRGAELRFAREATPRLVEILEDYFGIPYPFEKLDSLAIPDTPAFGAMENAGLITYDLNLLLAKPHEETVKFKRHYAAVGGHEIAHQWFGNLVTLAWWDDTWLNEAFATWMEHKVLDAYRPEWNSGWERGAQRRQALASDRLVSARRIQNPVIAENDVYDAFDGITYQKGAEVLGMFEGWLGPERFRKGVREYLAAHAGGTATSRDFFEAIAQASGRSESALAAFRGFVEQPGLPLVDVGLRCGKGPPALEVSQRRFQAAGTLAPQMKWTTPACFRYRAHGAVQTQCEEILNERRRIGISRARAGSCPDWVAGNANGAGHWIARYDGEALRKIEKGVPGMPENDAVALAFDTSLLVSSGLIPMGDALILTDGLLRHPAAAVQHGGVFVIEKQRDEWLSPAEKAQKKDLLARRIQPLARRLGWIERKGDTDATRSLRALVLAYAARETGGEPLRREARALALRWIDDRQSVDATMVPAVLETAARFADEATYARLEAALFATRSQRERGDILKALGAVREPQLRDRALAIAMRAGEGPDALGGGELEMLLEGALGDDANRLASFAYLREHWDPLAARIPAWSVMRLASALGRLCTPAERETFSAFFRERAEKFPGGPMNYAQALETIDICIAARSAPAEHRFARIGAGARPAQ